MPVDVIFCQSIPFVAICCLLLVNAAVKGRVFCATNALLLYTALSFGCALWLCQDPRTGDPFASQEAMVFLSGCYLLLCAPMLFIRENGVDVFQAEDPVFEGVFLRMLPALKAFAVVMLLTFAFCFIWAIPTMMQFVTSGMDRAEFRYATQFSHRDSLLLWGFSFISQFSLCAIAAGVLSTMSRKVPKWVTAGLLLGGFSYALSTLRSVSRSNIFEALAFLGSSVLVAWPCLHVSRRRFLRRSAMILIVVALLPFGLLTVVRFLGPNSINGDEGVFYGLASYFATGPYSFNADYVARMEYGTPSFNGYLTCSFLPNLRDAVFGTITYEDAEELMLEMADPGFPEYRNISGASSAEFKTVVGTFLMDYSGETVIAICGMFCLFFSYAFWRIRNACLSGCLLKIFYFYLIVMGPIGFGFGGRPRHYAMLGLLLFWIGLVFLEKRMMRTWEARAG